MKIYIKLLITFGLVLAALSGFGQSLDNPATIGQSARNQKVGDGLEVTDTLLVQGTIWLPSGAVDGYFLKTASNGVGTWQFSLPGQWTAKDTNIYFLGGNVGIGDSVPVAKLDVRSTTKSINVVTSYSSGAITQIFEQDTLALKSLNIAFSDTVNGQTIDAFLSVGGTVPPVREIAAGLGVQFPNNIANRLRITQNEIEIEYEAIDSQSIQLEFGADLFGAGLTGFSIGYIPNIFGTETIFIAGLSGGLGLFGGNGTVGGDGTFFSYTSSTIVFENTGAGSTAFFQSDSPTDGFKAIGADANGSNTAFSIDNSAGEMHSFKNDGSIFFVGDVSITGNIQPTDSIYNLGGGLVPWSNIFTEKISARGSANKIGSGLNPFMSIFGNTITAFTVLQGDTIAGGNLLLTSNTSSDGLIILGVTANKELFIEETSGKVGIGIGTGGSPDSRLHISTNVADTESILTLENTGTDIQIFNSVADPDSTITANYGDVVFTGLGKAYIKSADASFIGWQEILARTNTVVVRSESDLPDTIGGVHILEAGITYLISGVISLSFPINGNNAPIIGLDRTLDGLSFTGTNSSIFTGSGTVIAKNISLTATGSGMKVFDIKGTASDEFVYLQDCNVFTSDLGIIDSVLAAQFINMPCHGITGGITFKDVTNVDLRGFSVLSPHTADTIITLTGTSFLVQLFSCGFGVGVAQVGVDISDITITSFGQINAGTGFTGLGMFISGAVTNEWEIEAKGVQTQKDETASGLTAITTPIETAITTVSTPVKVLGTTTTGILFRVDDNSVSNRLRYTGTKTRNFDVAVSGGMVSATSNTTFTYFIAKNGSIIANSGMPRKQGISSDVGSISLHYTVELSTNDFVEVFVQNDDDTSNLTLQTMVITIN